MTALRKQMAMYSPDGRMPKAARVCPERPAAVLRVLQQHDDNVKDKQIDLAKTDTTEFVDHAS